MHAMARDLAARGHRIAYAGLRPADPAWEHLPLPAVAGAAGIAIAVWVAAACGALHAAHRIGPALPIASTVVAALILMPWLLGYGAATSLLAFAPLTVFGIALLRIDTRDS